MPAVPPMQDGCPWSALSHWAPPTVKWCEAQVCSWVVEPANTWSNLVFILFGVWLLVRARRSGEPMDRVFGWAQVAVGATSLAYHASYTFVFQILDFLGMYVFMGLLVVFNLVRMGVLARRRLWPAYAAGVLALTVATPFVAQTSFPIQGIVGALVVVTLATEALARRRATAPIASGWLGASLGFIAVAAVCSAADAARVWCVPENHLLQGHAVWHALSATSLFCAWGYYRQFARELLAPDAEPAQAAIA